MKKLEHRESSRQSTEDIEDAEFIEIEPAPTHQPVPSAWTFFDWWHERGFITRAGLVLSPLIFAAMCVSGPPPELNPTENSTGVQADENSTGTMSDEADSNAGPAMRTKTSAEVEADWLVGSWILTPRGGEDGETNCGDFNAPPLYRLNDESAVLISFEASGRYRAMFAYTTPSGSEHYTRTFAQWQMSNSGITLADITVRDAFTSKSEHDSRLIDRVAQNVMMLGNETNKGRFVRCRGEVDSIFGDL